MKSEPALPRRATSESIARHDLPPRPDAPPSEHTRVAATVGISLLVLVAYLGFPNQNYGLDSAWYASEARYAEDLFHPHHLLYNAFGYLLNGLVARVHPVDTIALLAFANGLFSAGLILCLYLTIRRLVGSAWLAGSFALLCGFSSGIWQMATTVEVYPLTLLCEVAALLVLTRPLATVSTVVVGVLCGTGMLFHQTGVFFAPVMALLIVWTTGSRRRALAALVVAFLVVAIPYVVVAYGKGVRTPAQLAHWLVSYTDSPQYRAGHWGGGLSSRKFILAPFGLVVALFSPVLAEAFRGGGPLRLSPFEVAATLPILVFIAVAVGTLWVTLRGQRSRLKDATDTPQRRAWRRAMLVWLLLHGAFTLWWEPGNAEFWLMLFPALAILLALSGRARLSELPSAPLWLAILVVTMLLGNFASRIFPNSLRSRNAALQVMTALDRHGPRRSAVVIFGTQNELATYTKYFWGPQRAATTNSLSFTSFASPAERPQALLAYQAQVAEVVRAGGAYLLASELSPSWPQLLSPPYWTAEEYRRAYAPFLAHAETIGSFEAEGRRYAIMYLASP